MIPSEQVAHVLSIAKVQSTRRRVSPSFGAKPTLQRWNLGAMARRAARKLRIASLGETRLPGPGPHFVQWIESDIILAWYVKTLGSRNCDWEISALNECLAVEVLQAYAHSQLHGDQIELVELHLESCERCCIHLSRVVDGVDAPTAPGPRAKVNHLSPQAVASSSLHGAADRDRTRSLADDVAEPMPPMIGRYRIEKLLGQGALAVSIETTRN